MLVIASVKLQGSHGMLVSEEESVISVGIPQYFLW